jgi:hypothetical protein
VTPHRGKSRAAKAVGKRRRNARMSSCGGSCSTTSERRRWSRRLATAESMPQGPAYRSSAATSPAKSAKAPSKQSVAMRPGAFFSPSLAPVVERGPGDPDTVVTPQGPTRWAGGHAVRNHAPHCQIAHAVGILTARGRQIGEVRVTVRAALRTVVLRRGDHEITRTPEVEIPEVVQRPLARLGPLSLVTTTRPPLARVGAPGRDNLWRWQVDNRGHPCGGIGSIRPRTDPGFVLRARMSGPQLDETGPSGARSKPGKDAIVSQFITFCSA